MIKPKIITFYLPQFHTIPENDEWWGKGFTDWISARKAKRLFLGHYQPRLPAHNYYYDLLDKKTMQWQAELAHKAGIYGFCIYHYWFGDDKQLLQKPAENLLQWKDIDINYCFSWANESWVCSWSQIQGNSWMVTDYKTEFETNRGMLVEQKYGEESEWKKHFEYLLPFFHDRRYIKKDNKPIFVIYEPTELRRARVMTEYWNELAKEHGFSGIYFIGTNDRRWKWHGMDAGMLYEPKFSFRENNKDTIKGKKWNKLLKNIRINVPHIYSYCKMWERILNRSDMEGVYYGGFVDYDDSPRRGVKGKVVWRMTPDKFGQYFGKLYKKATNRGDEYIFLTAWNEWGEGAYLEPDSKYGVSSLQEIRKIIKGKMSI